MRFIYFCCLLFTFLAAHSQDGTLYLKNYTVPLANINPAYNDILQLPWGDMLLANERGLVIYNGTSWKRIPIDDKPGVLFKTSGENPQFFIGNKNSIGILEFHEKHYSAYKQLVDTIPDGIGVIAIKEDGKYVYFQTSSSIYIFDKIAGTLLPNQHRANAEARLLNLQNKVFTLDSGIIYLIQGDSVKYQTQLSVPDPVVADIPFSDTEVLLATRNGNFFIFNGTQLSDFSTSANLYFEGNYITGGITISDSQFAISTLTGGVVLIDKNTGKAIHFVNYQTGLPDDEIKAMSIDNQQGLWICHGLGVSRVDLSLPVMEYSQYPGLVGDITCLRTIGNKLYVGTNEGLFYLSKVQRISEVSFLIKKESESQTNFQTYRRYQTINKKVRVTLEPRDTSSYEPFIEEVPFSLSVPYDSVVSSKSEQFTDKLSRQEYALQSIPYVFKKFSGLEGRCNQLILVDSLLLIATNKGLLELREMKLNVLLAGTQINYIKESIYHPDYYFAATDEGIVIIHFFEGSFHIVDRIKINYAVNSIAESQHKLLAGAENKLFSIRVNSELAVKSITPLIETSGENSCVNISPDSILWISGKNGWVKSVSDKLAIADINKEKVSIKNTENILYAQQGYVWTYSENDWQLFSAQSANKKTLTYLNLFQEVKDIFLDPDSSIWLVQNHKIYKISKPEKPIQRSYSSRIVHAHDRSQRALSVSDIDLKYNNNSVYLNLATPFYLGEKSTRYRYMLSIPGSSWTAWNSNPEIVIQYLEPGSYTLNIQSKNVLGEITETIPISIHIKPPFYRSWWFILLVIGLGILLIRLIILYRTRALERENRRLQIKVDEATAEIVSQKNHIERLYTNIRSSINYAERIQNAILPKSNYIQKVLPDSFLLFKPQDVVSGDFYWFHDTDEYFILIASDCTGHGVPGAFMSMIGNTLLNQIIKEEQIIDPAEILHRLDRDIIISLQQDKENSELRDGMDLAICTYFKKKNELHFGGAMNSLYLFEKNEFRQVAADLNPVGGVYRNMKKEFNTQIVPLNSETIAYIFSDGYPDQLGGNGPRRMKFNTKQFKEMLAEIKNKPFAEQEELLDTTIQNWLGERKQNDDILVIGFRINPEDFNQSPE